eukprot:2028888-Rhodomonas_salina.3
MSITCYAYWVRVRATRTRLSGLVLPSAMCYAYQAKAYCRGLSARAGTDFGYVLRAPAVLTWAMCYAYQALAAGSVAVRALPRARTEGAERPRRYYTPTRYNFPFSRQAHVVCTAAVQNHVILRPVVHRWCIEITCGVPGAPYKLLPSDISGAVLA